MAMSGSLKRAQVLSRGNDASIAFAGSSSGKCIFFHRALAAVISFAGDLSRQGIFHRSLTGVISFVGALSRFAHYRRRVISKRVLLEDGLDLLLESGAKVYLEAAKVLTFSGSLTRNVAGVAISIAGSMGFTAAIARVGTLHRSLAGTISPSGVLTRLYVGLQRTAVSVLSFNATIARKFVGSRIVAGTISSAATLLWEGGRHISGVLSGVGSLVRFIHFRRSASGEIDTTGIGERTRVKFLESLTGVLKFQGITRRTAVFVKKGLSRFGFNFDEE